MLCSDLMKLEVECCLDTALVHEAAVAMRDRDVGFLPICGEARVAVGTLTDRDIVVRALAFGRAGDATLVSAIMTPEVVACHPEDELAVAEQLMIRFQKSRIMCVDGGRRVVGVISLSDVAKVEPHGHAGRVAAAIAIREAAALPRKALTEGEALTCAEVMKRGVECCRFEESAASVARIMQQRNVGFVPVCNDAGAVRGVLTDRDLVLRVVAERRDADATRADQVLTPEVVVCSPDDLLRDAEEQMARHKKSRIVCVDERKRPVGVISLSDVARVERAKAVTRVLRAVSTRTHVTA
jgi:CBS domain-containing protein